MSLNRLVHELCKIDYDLARLEKQVSALKSKRHLLATVDIPEAMTEEGRSYIELSDGSNLACSVDFKVYGSLPSRENPEARQEAIDYLKENDGAELITAKVLVTFDRGDISSANKLKRLLLQKTNRPITVDAEVHHSSLAAWARARIKANSPINFEKVGLRGLTMASVKELKR